MKPDESRDMNHGRRLIMTAATCVTLVATSAQAQRNPKPVGDPQCGAEQYVLVANGPVGPWQTADAQALEGSAYNPGTAQTICGDAMNSQPLKCMTTSNAPAVDGDSCLGQAMVDYDQANPGRKAMISTQSPTSFHSVATKNLGSCQTAIVRGTWRTTPGDRPSGCGQVMIPVIVQCVNFDTGAALPDSACASERPASMIAGEDRSACPAPTPSPPPPEPVTAPPAQTPPPVQLKLGTCNYTSSGGGRFACGEYMNYRPGPKAPAPRELCTGRLLAGSDGQGVYDDARQTPSAGVGWTTEPVVDASVPAQCIVHWRSGYSDNGRTASWFSAYYSGPPTGVQGGLFVGKKP